jgi:hypothetical protein
MELLSVVPLPRLQYCSARDLIGDRQDFGGAHFGQAAIDPLLGQLSLHAVLRQTGAEADKVYVIQLLVPGDFPEINWWCFRSAMLPATRCCCR